MLNLPKFAFKNFLPREGVAEEVNLLLEIISELSPSDSTCIATIEKWGSKFRFEITIYSIAGKFQAKRFFDTQPNRPTERDWHIPIVRHMCHEVWSELKDWNLRRGARRAS